MADDAVISNFTRNYSASRDVVKLLIDHLGETTAERILQMHPSELRQTARVNLLKTSREEAIRWLAEEEIRAIPLGDFREGIEIVHGGERIGYSVAYLAGMVMPQGLGSMLAVDVLDPQPDETILDLSAAPGNKTAFIAERMGNTGTLVANDKNRGRLSSLRSNLNRHGIRNTVVTAFDGTEFPNEMKFDRILLDAPCTGEGLIVSSPQRRKSRDLVDPYILQRVQQRLFRRALRMLKKDGVIVYSTCSMNSIENEEVISLFSGLVQVEQIDKSLEVPAVTSPDLAGAIRLLPSTHGCDGFFIARGRRL